MWCWLGVTSVAVVLFSYVSLSLLCVVLLVCFVRYVDLGVCSF